MHVSTAVSRGHLSVSKGGRLSGACSAAAACTRFDEAQRHPKAVPSGVLEDCVRGRDLVTRTLNIRTQCRG